MYHPGTRKYLPARSHVILTVKGGRCVFLILGIRKTAQYVCCLPRVTELVNGWTWTQPVCLTRKPALLLINRPTPLFGDTAQHGLQDVLLRVVFCASDTAYLPLPGRMTEQTFMAQRPAHEAQEASGKPSPTFCPESRSRAPFFFWLVFLGWSLCFLRMTWN